MPLASITWDVSPEIFSIGPVTIRWYGLLFASAFIIGYRIMLWIFKNENKSENDLNDLIWYIIIGVVVGARLGHCLFYNPSYYLSNPLEILQVWKGGLASHGAAVGITLALYVYTKKKKDQPYLWISDRVIINVALVAFFVRMGNLFNSEIIGKPADLPWSFIYTSVDNVPRHPTQVYEALAYLIIFAILINIYRLNYKKLRDGFLLGIFFVLLFGFRFFVEFFKENQTYFEEGLPLNMGQLLSIPLVVTGLYLIISKRGSRESETLNSSKGN
jgi:prolipoprotein diacylglyceryl transferase